MSSQKSKLNQSLNDSVKSLGNAFQALYGLAPLAVLTGCVLSIGVISATLLWTPLMMGTAVLLVVTVSLFIFAFRGNFGDAMLSLVGGLLTVFALEWTVGRYIAFSAAWIGFTLAALLIASVKLAAKTEEIYRQAALRIVGVGPKLQETEKKLRTIGSSSSLHMLGPIERAEVIRLLAFRNLPLDLFLPCLNAVETLSVVTKCKTETIAVFLSDCLISFPPESQGKAQDFVDLLFDVIRDCPVPPEEFFTAFERSRRLLISQAVAPNQFLEGLRNCLTSGVNPDDIYNEMRIVLNVQ